MNLLLCAVFDSKVGAYASPFCARTKGEAIRSFEQACRDDSLPFKRHPADYRLFLIGEYDDNLGRVRCGALGPEPLIGADEIAPEYTTIPSRPSEVGDARDGAKRQSAAPPGDGNGQSFSQL